MCSVEQQAPRQQRGPKELDPGDSADGRLSEPRPLSCPASCTGGVSGPCAPAVPPDEPPASVPRRSSTSAGGCSSAGGTEEEEEASGEEASERGPRPLNSAPREHVNPQEIGGAKEATASASRLASDRGDGLDNPVGPCGLAGRERRLPPAVPTLALDPPPVRYEPRRATGATPARRAGERRKLSQHSKSSRPPRSSANDDCCVRSVLACLYCEFASLCWMLVSCACCCHHCCSCAEESGAGDAERCLGGADCCPGAELGGGCCCCGCCCVYCCCCCGPEAGEDVPPCGLCGDVDGGMLQGCCESSDCVEICFECCGFCLLS
ncbi:myoD family inhibitor domain-containing protein isoform X2 [Petromyzon marinus]|uniref:MyoD family inhibitor domain-containing protein isoform X2 n=1 Tax=Petromyzon marinus TaxID=7757 RepID=A0AAJ7T2M8_PETMA|nr:myoD family inhibitor domain-containing protein isoform X2 [Petromyzon marinus]